MKTIKILGKKWKIEKIKGKDDLELVEADGYTSTKNGERRIAIKKDGYLNKELVLRHELIHAFLLESGLGFCCEWANNEEMVDWFARNWTRIDKLMNKAIKKVI